MVTIKSFPRYTIDEAGKIHDTKRNQPVAVYISNGYKMTNLVDDNNKRHRAYVHRLLETEFGIKPGGIIRKVGVNDTPSPLSTLTTHSESSTLSTFDNMNSSFKIKLVAGTPCILARDIHKAMQISSAFSIWVKPRLSNMQEGIDYLPATRPGDVYLTVEGAKVVAMTERGGRGFDIRKELMEFEARHLDSLKAQAAQPKTVELDAETVFKRLSGLEAKIQLLVAAVSNPSSVSLFAPATTFYTLSEYYEVNDMELPSGLIAQLVEQELVRKSAEANVEVKVLVGSDNTEAKSYSVDILASVTGF